MIEKFEDLGLSREDTLEVVQAKVLEKLETTIEAMSTTLSEYVKEHSSTLVEDMVNIIPYGDYGTLLEEKEEMAKFLRDEAAQDKNWKLYSIKKDSVTESPDDKESKKELICFCLDNKAVDDGDVFKGYCYYNYQGKLVHAFVQNDS